MPTIEYDCPKCGHVFKRVVFRGEERPSMPCPKCKSMEVKPSHSAESLFNGISPSSSLAKDTN
ncbi:zinc ribbon domain-containing protein [Desulfobotulus sp. H1]|uniref:Zinc ribbon domain-containing protein n=1 Tax=Desulfobotulus pelophilus TaxID=2823377 RepID=A0ABT3NE17_9BACT|nr:zinc ribbon domain-containing protein [Desulfobotulus pelophilus]MCW7755431.1 zinc ribbon domain-containing protein [Desulfobotulus pelophilus]